MAFGEDTALEVLISAKISELKAGMDEAAAATADGAKPLTIVLAAAQRRYPAMTRAELEENLDFPTLRVLWRELWSLSFLSFQAGRGPKQ